MNQEHFLSWFGWIFDFSSNNNSFVSIVSPNKTLTSTCSSFTFGDIPLYYDAGDAKMLLRTLDNIKFHKPATNSVDYLKNKFNFDAAGNILDDIIKQYTN